jgi:thioredoxin-related protein
MNHLKIFIILLSITFMVSCSSLQLEPAQFGWPIESVLKVDKDGFVKEDRYSISFNTKALFFDETQDTLSYAGKSIRLIRNNEGFYFMTSTDFKNVYVFGVNQNSFSLENKIFVSETGLVNPVFNQRSPFIELIDENITYKITSNGIEEGIK